MLGVFTLLHQQRPELFHRAKLKLCPRNTSPHYLLPQLLQPLFYSVSTNSTTRDVCGIQSYLPFGDWLVSLSMSHGSCMSSPASELPSFLFKAEHCSVVRSTFCPPFTWVDSGLPSTPHGECCCHVRGCTNILLRPASVLLDL